MFNDRNICIVNYLFLLVCCVGVVEDIRDTIMPEQDASTPDLITSQGIRIRYRDGALPWEVNQIEAQINGFLVNTPNICNGENISWLKDVNVYVFPAPIKCGSASTTGYCNGLQGTGRIFVRRFDCPAHSGLTHELMHWLQMVCQNVNDYNHEDLVLWKIADIAYPGGCDDT
jgi:hypothetical protein